MIYIIRLCFGLAIIAGGFAMVCYPDPRYADLPAYQESSGTAAALLILMGLALGLSAGDR